MIRRIIHLGLVSLAVSIILLGCAGKPLPPSTLAEGVQAVKVAPTLLEVVLSEEEKSRYDQAITDSTKALELNPGDARAYTNRGVAYGGKGQYDLEF